MKEKYIGWDEIGNDRYWYVKYLGKEYMKYKEVHHVWDGWGVVRLLVLEQKEHEKIHENTHKNNIPYTEEFDKYRERYPIVIRTGYQYSISYLIGARDEIAYELKRL